MSTSAPQDQFAKIGQVNTRYWAQGARGSTVTLLHGLGGSVENWMENIAPLSERHRVHALDMVGFGRSDKPQVPYSADLLVRFVNDFMAEQGIERTSLVGNSMGGLVALQLALLSPEKVDKLVLVASAGLGREITMTLRLISLPFIGEWLSRPSREGAVQVLQACYCDQTLITDEAIDHVYQMYALPGAQEAYLATLRSMCNFWGVRAEILSPILEGLGGIKTPTLIVWGQQDQVLPVNHADVAAKGIRHAQLHVFDPCGHVPQLERPEEFNALVLEFLAG